jgi:putative transposase
MRNPTSGRHFRARGKPSLQYRKTGPPRRACFVIGEKQSLVGRGSGEILSQEARQCEVTLFHSNLRKPSILLPQSDVLVRRLGGPPLRVGFLSPSRVGWPTLEGGVPFSLTRWVAHRYAVGFYVIDRQILRTLISGMTQLRHYDHDGAARFITFSCYRRFRIFESVSAINILIEQLSTLRSEFGIQILGYVIMPEHVHLVLWPPAGVGLGMLIGQVKGRAGRRIIIEWNGQFPRALAVPGRADRQYQVFQRRCYDHNCRTAEIVKEKIEYCHKNPVMRGLVSSPGEWEWSSYRWYQGRRDVPLEVDEVAL